MRLHRCFIAILAVAALLGAATTAPAGVITSAGGYSVGLTDLGNLYDPGANIGFLRLSDGYDPIQPGTPREAYGLAAGAISGFADPSTFGVANIVQISSVFGGNTATIVTQLVDPGSGVGLLELSQVYTFVADNVMNIRNTITNISGISQLVTYSREVDHDINPAFVTTTTVDPFIPGVIDATYYGFENADPLVPYAFSSGPAGFRSGVGDLGGGFKFDVGILAAGASYSFDVAHAITTPGQDGVNSDATLRAQLYGLGYQFVITSIEDDGLDVGDKSAALGLRVVPEPTAVVSALVGGVMFIGVAVRRRRRS